MRISWEAGINLIRFGEYRHSTMDERILRPPVSIDIDVSTTSSSSEFALSRGLPSCLATHRCPSGLLGSCILYFFLAGISRQRVYRSTRSSTLPLPLDQPPPLTAAIDDETFSPSTMRLVPGIDHHSRASFHTTGCITHNRCVRICSSFPVTYQAGGMFVFLTTVVLSQSAFVS